ncbi:hypothetical protein F5Y18DRAFT_424475 [Xylariaceae sp. FL1019]|nr:hypothetical protein F5Y18DRAFT_424475 [Xylariaceae sp. FL1019]
MTSPFLPNGVATPPEQLGQIPVSPAPDGLVSNFIDPPSISYVVLITIGVIFPLMLAFLLLRLYARIKVVHEFQMTISNKDNQDFLDFPAIDYALFLYISLRGWSCLFVTLHGSHTGNVGHSGWRAGRSAALGHSNQSSTPAYYKQSKTLPPS